VTDEKAIDDSVEKTVKAFGRLDYAVNNAGIGGAIDTSDQIQKDDFEKVLSVNLTAVWLCQRAQIRQMLKQERLSESYRSYRGSIVNVASMFGLVAPPLNMLSLVLPSLTPSPLRIEASRSMPYLPVMS
jgi:NAD(P)-dependent dehydrogenase (short-subunit alcohol dehydrogenase family)